MSSNSTILVMVFSVVSKMRKKELKVCYEHENKLEDKKTNRFQQKHFLILYGSPGLMTKLCVKVTVIFQYEENVCEKCKYKNCASILQ